MSDPIKQLMKDMLDVKKRLARLEANDSFDVEEWTAWTPELYGTTTDGTLTYSTQNAFYLRIDDMVFIYGRVVVSGITVAPTGNLRIRTLPYSSPNSAINPPVLIQSNADLSAGYSHLIGNFDQGGDTIVLTQAGDNVLQNYPAANLAAGDTFRFSAFYRASV